MIFYFIVFLVLVISTFLITYVCVFIFSPKKIKIVRENLYLIIPIYCVFSCAFYNIFLGNFFAPAVTYDFTNYYNCGKQLLKDPMDLYNPNIINDEGGRYGYKYLPNFAVFIGLPLSFIPSMQLAYWIFYIINILFGIYFTILFNQILCLMNLKDKLHRFLFLLVVSNGWFVLQLYVNNQLKYLIGIGILFVIKRELYFNANGLKKDLKYYLIHYNILIFIVGMAPYFILLLLIYLFHDIPNKQILYTKYLKRYFILIGSFIAQNFLFVLYPRLIYEFYAMYLREAKRVDSKLNHFYLEYLVDNFIYLSGSQKSFISTTMNIILYIIVIILAFDKRMELTEKLGIYSLSTVILNYIAYRIALILFPLITLLFIPYLYQEERGFNFLKKNKVVIIALFSIFFLYLTPNREQFHYPYIEGIYLSCLFYVIILVSCVLILYLKYQ